VESGLDIRSESVISSSVPEPGMPYPALAAHGSGALSAKVDVTSVLRE
jgi:hypothetical protein